MGQCVSSSGSLNVTVAKGCSREEFTLGFFKLSTECN